MPPTQEDRLSCEELEKLIMTSPELTALFGSEHSRSYIGFLERSKKEKYDR